MIIEPKQKKTQVVGFRVNFATYNTFEQLCLERQVPMSKVLQTALKQFVNENNSEITAKAVNS